MANKLMDFHGVISPHLNGVIYIYMIYVTICIYTLYITLLLTGDFGPSLLVKFRWKVEGTSLARRGENDAECPWELKGLIAGLIKGNQSLIRAWLNKAGYFWGWYVRLGGD